MIQCSTMQGSATGTLKEPPVNPLNRNILIVGSSGAGKSTLMRAVEQAHPPHLKLLFKPDGEKSLSVRDNRPFLEPDRVNFVESWKESLKADNTGYMLIQQQILIENLRQTGQSLTELRHLIQKQGKQSERIESPIYKLIELRLSHLYPNYTSEIRASGKLSFDGLTEDEYLFFCDYILRNAYAELQDEIISIDEIHRLTPLLPGTISRITREIRSRGGLIATTQSMSDLPPALINNFGTIYVFQDIDIRDLKYLEAIDRDLKSDVLNLLPHEFIEIRSYRWSSTQGNTLKMELIHK